MAVHADKLARQDASRVNVRRERLEAFVVAEDLRSAGRGHWGDEQRVSSTELHDLFAQFGPVITLGVRFFLPKIELEFSL